MSAVPQQFQAVPDTQELGRVPRDLRFHPAVAESPQSLTVDQLQAFNRDGFIRPIRIYSDSEITQIRDYFDGLLQQALDQGRDSYSISTAHLKHAGVYDMLTDPRIIDCVADLLGEDLIAWGSHFFCKLPNDGRAVAWHQDASYWPLSPSRAVTVWLAIDDADLDNGCMKFIAGSHHSGHLTYQESSPDEHNVLNQTVENVEQYGSEVVDDLRAGEISIHSDLLLHGSDANNSDRRRCGLTLRYCSADVRAEMGWNAKGVIVRGSDNSGHWKNPPRPPEP